MIIAAELLFLPDKRERSDEGLETIRAADGKGGGSRDPVPELRGEGHEKDV